jgi:integrase
MRAFLGAFLALALSPHVFVRPGELRQAAWAEFDWEASVWRIPAAQAGLLAALRSVRGEGDPANLSRVADASRTLPQDAADE